MQLLSVEEEACESNFRQNVQRNQQGRYIVRLPFNGKQEQLGSTYELAQRRFYALERKLNRNENLKDQYRQFMREYEDLGHMQRITTNDRGGYFIPHHAVLKESSLTTKLRVVFDASARSTTGLSLNDTLLVGPVIQEGVFQLMLRFRQHNFVLTADVEKMFRQFLVHPDDRRYQRILWRYRDREPLQTYQLQTITYGLSAAPFLATRCLTQLSEDEGQLYPEAADALKNDIYVDDLLTGAETLEATRILRDQLIAVTEKAGLRFCKWASNDVRLVDDLPDSTNMIRQKICEEHMPRTLGVCWNPLNDTLNFEVNIDQKEGKLTKRIMLSQIAQLYDPLGLLAPMVVFAKIRLQDLWKLTLTWDEPVPNSLANLWHEFKEQLKSINNWNIPRAVKIVEHDDLQLHGFADASEKPYGSCIYLRSSNRGGCHSMLLCAKSRVAPVKTVTLPRLELCAAVLLVKLYNVVKTSLRLSFEKTTFWLDSTIALNWINTSPHTLKTFVANRVSEIQTTTNILDWKHVPTKENPADCISRGQLPQEFLENQLWKNGPTWLIKPESLWPNNPLQRVEITETKKTHVPLNIAPEECELWSRFSSLSKLTSVVAYCIRFIKGMRRETHNTGLLSVAERREALTRII